jgi:REP element-mobilizing transposase RayT
VTVRVLEEIPSLRRMEALRILHEAVIAVGRRDDFRVVEFNVLTNHLHFVIEAGGALALASGMKALKVRLAKRLNRLLGRSGQVFAERYHARSLKTPAEVRNALRYVLLNQQHHERHGEHWFGVDKFSSAAWFDGWADDRWRHEQPDCERPTSPARTWLLRTGWRRHGLIGFDELDQVRDPRRKPK